MSLKLFTKRDLEKTPLDSRKKSAISTGKNVIERGEFHELRLMPDNRKGLYVNGNYVMSFDSYGEFSTGFKELKDAHIFEYQSLNGDFMNIRFAVIGKKTGRLIADDIYKLRVESENVFITLSFEDYKNGRVYDNDEKRFDFKYNLIHKEKLVEKDCFRIQEFSNGWVYVAQKAEELGRLLTSDLRLIRYTYQCSEGYGDSDDFGCKSFVHTPYLLRYYTDKYLTQSFWALMPKNGDEFLDDRVYVMGKPVDRIVYVIREKNELNARNRHYTILTKDGNSIMLKRAWFPTILENGAVHYSNFAYDYNKAASISDEFIRETQYVATERKAGDIGGEYPDIRPVANMTKLEQIELYKNVLSARKAQAEKARPNGGRYTPEWLGGIRTEHFIPQDILNEININKR